jgi:hypothetical protein
LCGIKWPEHEADHVTAVLSEHIVPIVGVQKEQPASLEFLCTLVTISAIFPPAGHHGIMMGIVCYMIYRVTKKRELLKNPTKIEEIQEKKFIDRN